MFKLDKSSLLGSKRIAYEYACISRYHWHMKIGTEKFCENYPGSLIILKNSKLLHALIKRKLEHHIVPMLLPYLPRA